MNQNRINLNNLEKHDKNTLQQVDIKQQQFNNFKDKTSERTNYETNEKKDRSLFFAYIVIVGIIIIITAIVVLTFLERR